MPDADSGPGSAAALRFRIIRKWIVRNRAGAAALTIAAAVTLAVAGCTPGSSSASSGGPGGSGATGTSASEASLHWVACGSAGGPAMRCGRISVPLNYADAGGRKITLALTEVPATAPASQQ